MNGGLIKSREILARLRSGRVVKAGINGSMRYNAEWLRKNFDTEFPRCGEWCELVYGGMKHYKCSVCKTVVSIKYVWCPTCNSLMYFGLNMSKEK